MPTENAPVAPDEEEGTIGSASSPFIEFRNTNRNIYASPFGRGAKPFRLGARAEGASTYS
jgi:hypothetical protein